MSIFDGGVYYPLGRSEDMSEGEYQATASLWADHERANVPAALRAPHGQWRTRDGREMRVDAMAVEHLRNVIKLFTRAGWGDHEKILELHGELHRRGHLK